jgi:hypothetical protein
MSRMIFVNLPVADPARSRAFYTALGFSINEQFSNEDAVCIVVSEHIYVMALSKPFFRTFTEMPLADASAQIGALYALSCDSRDAVDAMTAAALAAGGTEPVPARDMGFMYNRTFADPDGHTWEPMWMDPAATD